MTPEAWGCCMYCYCSHKAATIPRAALLLATMATRLYVCQDALSALLFSSRQSPSEQTRSLSGVFQDCGPQRDSPQQRGKGVRKEHTLSGSSMPDLRVWSASEDMLHHMPATSVTKECKPSFLHLLQGRETRLSFCPSLPLSRPMSPCHLPFQASNSLTLLPEAEFRPIPVTGHFNFFLSHQKYMAVYSLHLGF